MNDNLINADVRDQCGKGPARQLRLLGRIPGVFYFGDENFSFSVDSTEFSRMLRTRPGLVNLHIDGQDPRECVIRDVQRDPVYDTILHVDLMGIKRGQKLSVTVPIKMVGIAEGVKTGGGILQKLMTEVNIECLPKDIPHEIEVDVTDLNIGQSVYLESLEVPAVRFLDNLRSVIATVAPPTVVKTLAEEKAEAAEEKEAAETEAEESPEKSGS